MNVVRKFENGKLVVYEINGVPQPIDGQGKIRQPLTNTPFIDGFTKSLKLCKGCGKNTPRNG